MSPNDTARLPPGQTPTRSFPITHLGDVPTFDARTWDLRVSGLVERPIRFTWDELRALPRTVRMADMHASLGWSRLRNRWEGVPLRDLLGRARPKTEARFVRFTDGNSYDTTISMDLALEDDVIVADVHDGRPLDPMHGGPLRVVVPSRYAWKSCKWLRTIECLAVDKPGTWETRGHHPNADPWREERLSAPAGPSRA